MSTDDHPQQLPADTDTNANATSDASDVAQSLNMIANAMTAQDALRDRRSSFTDDSYGGKRDYYEVLGYPEDISADDFLRRYERQDVAQTLINKPATTTWRNVPEIHDDEDTDDTTDFEDDVGELLAGDHMDTTLVKYMEWVDRITGIGEYGLLVLFFKDNTSLDQEVNQSALSGPEDLTACRPIGQTEVIDWDLVDDPQDDRYGYPETYTIEIEQPGAGRGETEVDEKIVHHSRVVHIVENPKRFELKGTPRLEPVYNRLLDLEKVVGAAAEMFWSSAEPRWHADVRDDFEDLSEEDYKKFEKEVQEAIHGLRKVVQTKGMDMNVLDGQTPDPSGVVDVIFQHISSQSEIPQSVLKGNETGERATTQDLAGWYGRIEERQRQFAEAVILRPILDRLVEFGVLRAPQDGGYEVDWPPLWTASDQEIAETRRVNAVAYKEAQNAITMGADAESVFENALDWDLPEKYAQDDDQDQAQPPAGPAPASAGTATDLTEPQDTDTPADQTQTATATATDGGQDQ